MRMELWMILLIVGALVVLAAVFVGGRRAQARRVEHKREEAQELRTGAQEQALRAEQREQLAEEQAEQARRERAEAEEQARRADELDPDVDRDRED